MPRMSVRRIMNAREAVTLQKQKVLATGKTVRNIRASHRQCVSDSHAGGSKVLFKRKAIYEMSLL